MIVGNVTNDREIVIPLELIASDRSPISARAVLDTGFDGHLTLPTEALNSLRVTSVGTRRAELGDGHVVEMDVFVVRVNWHDQEREVLALQAETAPLIGMSLLWGSRVVFDAQFGGTLRIDEIARPTVR